MIFLYGVPMFVGCCAILWIYWNRFKKPRGHHKKKIFISGDVLLSVFQFLAPSQLGLGIALVSHRFDIIVDEHFKTRRWVLNSMEIWRKFWKFFTKEMEIVKYSDGEALPIPQVQLPRKVVGFKFIDICFIDQNVITFLHHFRPLFAACPIYLSMDTPSDGYRIWKLILRNIWPMLGNNIHGMGLFPRSLRHLRQFVPSILNDCPSLRVVTYYDDFFIEFPADDNAMASDGQSVAKWLFTPLQNNMPKVFKSWFIKDKWNFAAKIEAFKAAFASASSPVNFIVFILFRPSSFADSVRLFDMINELTREQLTLKRTDYIDCFLLIRCPIARDESKWTKWEEEAIGWEIYDQRNRIDIRIDNEREIGYGLLDATPGPNDQQK